MARSRSRRLPTAASVADGSIAINPDAHRLPQGFVADVYDGNEWRRVLGGAVLPPLPQTDQGLRAFIMALRAQVAKAVTIEGRFGIRDAGPVTSWGKAVFIPAWEDAFFLPRMEPLFMAVAATGVENLPRWAGEPQSDPEAIQMLDDLAKSLLPGDGHLDPAVLKEPPTIWYHGGQSYSPDGHCPLCVSKEQHNILEAFLDGEEALDTKILSKNGVSNVTLVMQKLADKFGNAVRRPKNKGEGYFVRVRTLKKPH